MERNVAKTHFTSATQSRQRTRHCGQVNQDNRNLLNDTRRRPDGRKTQPLGAPQIYRCFDFPPPCCSCFCTFAQVSRSVAVRLKTGALGFESTVSTQK